MAQTLDQRVAGEMMPVSGALAIDMVDVNKWFGAFHVLKDISLQVARGERIVICGPSGSGKSTLIRCINRLEAHQSGRIVVDGHELTDDLRQIDKIRSEVGMVFQHFNLFPHLTVLKNITLAQMLVRKKSKGEAEDEAMQLLKKVNIAEKANVFPSQLSGGQQQRVAIARAVVTKPKLILADEPTGNLDTKTGYKVFQLLQEMSAEYSLSAVMVTHNLELAGEMNRCLTLADGKLHE